MKVELILGDCLEVLRTLPDNSIDSVVTDPPYGIGFMNKEWDNPQKHQELIEREKKRSQERFAEGKSPAKAGFSTGVQPGLPIGGAKEGKWFQDWCELWARECYRVLKPGGHALSFAAPRTYHRMATAFEDAGFQIRDQIMWVFGSGFPKSLNIGKTMDKFVKTGNASWNGTGDSSNGALGFTKLQHKQGYRPDDYSNRHQNKDKITEEVAQEYEGWGTALKPAHEPIVMARKPLSEKSIVENVLKHGTGGINIDGSRIGTDDIKTNGWGDKGFVAGENYEGNTHQGRWPANIIFDEEAGKLLDEQAPLTGSAFKAKRKKDVEGGSGASLMRAHKEGEDNGYFDERGGASRFFYCPKTSKTDRNEGLEKPSSHPTVKPTDLMRYLINLVTPTNGTILDPFMGSGSTGKAAIKCGVNFIGIEKEQEYIDIARARIEHEKNKPVQQTLFNGKS